MEMLVALAIFSIIAVGVSSVFRSGIRTWSAGNGWSEENQAARTFFRVLSKELQNSVDYSPQVPFVGAAHEISFMTLLDTRDPKEGMGRALARVVYRHDAEKRQVEKFVAGREEGFDLRKAEPQGIIEGVETLDFRYSYKPVYESQGVRWERGWKNENTVPRGVRIQMDDFHTAVFVPTGVLWDELAFG